MAVGRLGEHFIVETDVEPLTLPVSGQGMEDEAEGPGLPDEAPSIPWPEDEIVNRCLGDLIDDWQRKGGRLSYDDVTRMSTKRKLDGRQLASLLEALTRAGVTIAGLQSPAPEQHAVVDLDEEIADETMPAGRDALGAYLAEISRYPLLWAEDEVRLGRLIKAGQEAEVTLSEEPTRSLEKTLITQLRNAYEAGRRAHDQLVLSNLRLVVSVAKQGRYARSGLDLIDRIQDGNIGLMRAADKFDYTMGYKFSTYAMWWIRQSIERGIGDNSRLIRARITDLHGPSARSGAGGGHLRVSQVGETTKYYYTRGRKQRQVDKAWYAESSRGWPPLRSAW
jgi:RNA polymerase primary sigma factor